MVESIFRRRKALTLLSIVLLGVGSNTGIADGLPSHLAKIAVHDVQGRVVHPLADRGKRGTLFFFIAHDCPISNAYAPEMGRIGKAYALRGMAAFVVYVERDLSSSDARKHWKDYSFPCPALMDPRRTLIRLTGARMTPEAVIVAPNGKVVYRGRIDDTYVDFGKRRDSPQSRDLRRALDAFLDHKTVSPNRTTVIGCNIPDL